MKNSSNTSKADSWSGSAGPTYEVNRWIWKNAMCKHHRVCMRHMYDLVYYVLTGIGVRFVVHVAGVEGVAVMVADVVGRLSRAGMDGELDGSGDGFDGAKSSLSLSYAAWSGLISSVSLSSSSLPSIMGSSSPKSIQSPRISSTVISLALLAILWSDVYYAL